MAFSWAWLCVSLIAANGQPSGWGPPPNALPSKPAPASPWGSSQGSTDTKPAGSGAFHLSCTPGGAAVFDKGSGSALGQPVSADAYRSGTGHSFFPARMKNGDLILTGGSDPGWIAAWSAQSARTASPRECSLSLTSTDGQAVLAYALHHVVPVALDKDDRGLVSKLTLEMEGYDIVR